MGLDSNADMGRLFIYYYFTTYSIILLAITNEMSYILQQEIHDTHSLKGSTNVCHFKADFF